MASNRTNQIIVIVSVLILLGVAIVVNAQDETPEIDYCKYPDGEIVMVGEGSPCPNGSYPL
jgi:hypothetical protein